MLIAEGARSRAATSRPIRTPRAGGFYRSDHFSFAKDGVPAISFGSGNDLVNGGVAARRSARRRTIPRSTTTSRPTNGRPTGTSAAWPRTPSCSTPSASGSPIRATGRTGARTANSAPPATSRPANAAKRPRRSAPTEEGRARSDWSVRPQQGVVRLLCSPGSREWPTSSSTPIRSRAGDRPLDARGGRPAVRDGDPPYDRDEERALSRDQSDGEGPGDQASAATSSPSARRSAPISPTSSPRPSLGPRDEEKADYYRWLFFAAGPARSRRSPTRRWVGAGARAASACSAMAITTRPSRRSTSSSRRPRLCLRRPLHRGGRLCRLAESCGHAQFGTLPEARQLRSLTRDAADRARRLSARGQRRGQSRRARCSGRGCSPRQQRTTGLRRRRWIEQTPASRPSISTTASPMRHGSPRFHGRDGQARRQRRRRRAA